MIRFVWWAGLWVLLFLMTGLTHGQDDGPPVSITSPDGGTTFAYASIKNRSLIWDAHAGMLLARVTFTDEHESQGSSSDDEHEFRLPGVILDKASGLFLATSAKGGTIPVAHFKKSLFFKSIEVLPNARVRIIYPRGVITVILEAIRPDDPALRKPPEENDGTRPVDVHQLLH